MKVDLQAGLNYQKFLFTATVGRSHQSISISGAPHSSAKPESFGAPSERIFFAGVQRPATNVLAKRSWESSVRYRQGLTPIQAVIAAAGFLESASTDNVVLTRTGVSLTDSISRRLSSFSKKISALVGTVNGNGRNANA